LLDLRMACLDRQLSKLKALTRLFVSRVDGKILQRAVSAVLSLPSLQHCASPEALLAAYPPPTDPSLRAKIEQSYQRLDQITALEKSGQIQEGVKLAVDIEQETQALAYPPLQAKALALLGRLQSSAGQASQAESSLRGALLLAAEAKDDRVLAQVLAELIFVVGYKLARYPEAWTLEPVAAAAVMRAGNPAELRADVFNRLGIVFRVQGKYDQAIAYFQTALDLYQESAQPKLTKIAPTLNELGIVYRKKGDLDRALTFYRRCLDREIAALGPKHPNVGYALNNLGNVFFMKKEYHRALENYQKVVSIWEMSLGAQHPDLALVLNNLASVLHLKQQYQDAEQLSLRSLAIRRQALGIRHPAVASSLSTLGGICQATGRFDEAIAHYQQALAILEAVHSPRHPELTEVLEGLAACFADTGKAESAQALRQRVLAMGKAQGNKKQEAL